MHDDVSRRDVGQQQYGRPFGISWGLLKTTVLAGTDGDANVHRSGGFHCPVKRLLINQEYSMKKHKVGENALKAQLRTPMFKMQQQTPKKGKGSYSRKGRHAQRGHRQAA